MTPTTVIAGALLAQVILGVVLFIAAGMIKSAVPRTAFLRGEENLSEFGWEILVLMLFTIGMLVFSAPLSSLWEGLFKNFHFSGFSQKITIPVVFISNILITTRLVFGTGGSINSPFQPVFFLIPTLSLLLSEPTINIILYSLFSSICFCALLFQSKQVAPNLRGTIISAYGIVSISCLAITVVIGLLTRI